MARATGRAIAVEGQENPREKGSRMNPVTFLEADVLYCDDNFHRLPQFPSECIDLIYLDPPFFSNKTYEVIWGDEAEVRSFEDRWEGGIQVYLAWMRERMLELHRILKPQGSIYLHCDWHASHYLKVMMDDIFGGPAHMRNEIAWAYESGGRAKNFYPRKHDTIFWYSKSRTEWTFNADAVSVPRDECQACGTKLEKWNNLKKHVDEDGRIFRSIKSNGKVYTYYDDEPVLPSDVWLGINHLQQKDPERLGYPTQKPESLLKRIIAASSNPGDVVLDPFCGCGTAIAVAERLKRQWIGIDISPTAVGVMKRRLRKATMKPITVYGLPVTEDELRQLKPFEFQNWIMQRLNGTSSPKKTGDMGIDGFSFMAHDPIQVKQSDRIGRNVVDNFETAIERAGKEKGYIIGFSFTRGAYEEVARAKAAGKAEIKLIKVADLIGPDDLPDLRAPDLSDMFPKGTKTFLDLPLPEPRPAKARPSLEDLVKSDKESVRKSSS
jgi:DNA modification methylase